MSTSLYKLRFNSPNREAGDDELRKKMARPRGRF
jgi:hypothetical protein